MKFDEREFPVRAWKAFIIPPSLPVNGYACDSSAQPSNFSAHWLPRFKKNSSRDDLPLVAADLTDVILIESQMRALLRLSAYSDDASKQQCRWLLQAMIGQVWEESLRTRVSPVDRVINRQIAEMRGGTRLFKTINELSREASLSRVHYTRRFRRLTGQSPSQFLIRQRVERAAVLLRETNWTIETISQEVGYRDVYYFSRQFKATLKQSPSRFRS